MALSRSVRWLTLSVIVLLLSVHNDAQTNRPVATAQVPTVKFEGRVVADDTGLPLPNARVSPSFGAADLPFVSTLTDVMTPREHPRRRTALSTCSSRR